MAVVYFYYPKEVDWSDLKLDLASGLDCWILQTYLKLKNHNNEFVIRLTSEIPERGIIVFHKGYFPKLLKPTSKQLFVCVQADYGRHKYAQLHIVQNPLGKARLNFSRRAYFERFVFGFSKSYFIPHWNQPGIICRDENRSPELRNVYYFGAIQNLPAALRNTSFSSQLQQMDIEFHIVTNPLQWHNYSNSDCVLSIRDFDQKEHYHKPFSKIINSILAGVPVISGYESSVAYLNRQYQLQLPVAGTSKELEKFIIKLKNDYVKELENVKWMKKRITPFCDDAILQDWVLLLGKLDQLLRQWQGTNKIKRKFFFLVRS